MEGDGYREFLHTALLYQAITTWNTNTVDVLKQYSILVEKRIMGWLFYMVGYRARIIDLSLVGIDLCNKK